MQTILLTNDSPSFRATLTFTALACKISGLKYARTHLKNGMFSGPNTHIYVLMTIFSHGIEGVNNINNNDDNNIIIIILMRVTLYARY